MPNLLKRVARFGLCFGMGLLLCLLSTHVPFTVDRSHAVAQSVPQPVPHQSAEGRRSAIQHYQAGQYREAIALWRQALTQTTDREARAVLHSNLAQAYRQIGQLDQAIQSWDQAIALYNATQPENQQALTAQAWLEQAQAYSGLGQHRQAQKQAKLALELAKQLQDPLTTAVAEGVRGNADWALGNYDEAIDAHQKSLNQFQALNQPQHLSNAWGNLGNAYASRTKRYDYQANVARLEGDDREAARLQQLATDDLTAARAAYEASVTTSAAQGGMAEVKALLSLNQILAASEGNIRDIDQNRARVLQRLQAEPDSRDKVYALVSLANSLAPATVEAGTTDLDPEAQSLLETAIDIAQGLGDQRAASFALGTLGGLYEAAGDYEPAMALTQRAQLMAQQVNAGDSLYRWQWQLGRLLSRQGDKAQAIIAYRQAIGTLQGIRSDLLALNRELQFDVRDSVEPVYRELIDLLLDEGAAGLSESVNLLEALNTLELLKLTELQNFFGDECVQVEQVAKEQALDPTAAVVYSVVLKHRTVMILRSPDGTLHGYPRRHQHQSIATEN